MDGVIQLGGEGGGGRRRNPSFGVPELRDQEAQSTGIGEVRGAVRSGNRSSEFSAGMKLHGDSRG